ncbi:hypothetical protein [Anaerofustis butyriciformans]|uniref:hypothetical protein n=1 Tax=Anaerofustis butyriciformans TaxID=3108533 RepID=UPI002E37D1B4|nr:hypothetical protein [Anaerofustis sp. HA2171]
MMEIKNLTILLEENILELYINKIKNIINNNNINIKSINDLIKTINIFISSNEYSEEQKEKLKYILQEL